jgi:ankyrin repeat protein
MKWMKEFSQIKKDEPFMSVVYSGDLEKIKEMVEKGANVNARNNAGCTVLMLAGNIGRLDIMEYLNQKGAQIEAKTTYNNLALSVPIRYGYIDVIQFYISHSVDLNALGPSNQTALHLAVQAHRDALTPDFTPEKKTQNA